MIIKALKSTRGYVSIFGIFVMLVSMAFLAAVVPYAREALYMNTKNRDSVEAQYAAEAGAKRAIVWMNEGYTDWDWLNKPTPFYGNDPAIASYTVSITAGPAIPGGSAAGEGTYTIESIGKVNNVTRKIEVEVYLAAGNGSGNGGEYAADFLAYSKGNMSFGQNAIINGVVDSTGSISGVPTDKIVRNQNVKFPQIDIAGYAITAANIRAPYDGERMAGTYYIDGDWLLDNNMTFYGDAIIYINGNVLGRKAGNKVTFAAGSAVMLVVKGDISLKNKIEFDKAVLIAYGNIDLKNNYTLKGGTVMSAGTMNYENNADLTYNSDVLAHFGIEHSSTQLEVGVNTWRRKNQ